MEAPCYASSAGGAERLTDRLQEVDRSMLGATVYWRQRCNGATGGYERPVASADQEALAALVARRRQLRERRTAEATRLAETEEQIEEAVEKSPTCKEEEELLCSVPGIGQTTAYVLLAELPEIGEANRQEIAKRVGGLRSTPTAASDAGSAQPGAGSAQPGPHLNAESAVHGGARGLHEEVTRDPERYGQWDASQRDASQRDASQRDVLESGSALGVGPRTTSA